MNLPDYKYLGLFPGEDDFHDNFILLRVSGCVEKSRTSKLLVPRLYRISGHTTVSAWHLLQWYRIISNMGACLPIFLETDQVITIHPFKGFDNQKTSRNVNF